MKKQNRLAALLASVALVAGSLAMVACSSPVDSTPPVVETSISSVLNDKVYFVGDTVEKSDFTVKVKKGASTKTITADEFSVEVPAENLDANGKLKRSSGSTGRSESVKCTIKYEDLTKTKTITVSDKICKVTADFSEFKTEYVVEDTIDYSKIIVEVWYDEAGTDKETAQADKIKFTEIDTEVAGKTELKVSYNGVEAAETVEVTVTDPNAIELSTAYKSYLIGGTSDNRVISEFQDWGSGTTYTTAFHDEESEDYPISVDMVSGNEWSFNAIYLSYGNLLKNYMNRYTHAVVTIKTTGFTFDANTSVNLLLTGGGKDNLFDVSKYAKSTENGFTTYVVPLAKFPTEGVSTVTSSNQISVVLKGTGAATVNEFFFAVAEQGAVDTVAAQNAIDTVKNAVKDFVIGTEPNNYPQTAKDAFDTAIANAESVVSAANSTQDEVDAVVASVNEALKAYKDAKIIDESSIPKVLNPINKTPTTVLYSAAEGVATIGTWSQDWGGGCTPEDYEVAGKNVKLLKNCSGWFGITDFAANTVVAASTGKHTILHFDVFTNTDVKNKAVLGDKKGEFEGSTTGISEYGWHGVDIDLTAINAAGGSLIQIGWGTAGNFFIDNIYLYDEAQAALTIVADTTLEVGKTLSFVANDAAGNNVTSTTTFTVVSGTSTINGAVLTAANTPETVTVKAVNGTAEATITINIIVKTTNVDTVLGTSSYTAPDLSGYSTTIRIGGSTAPIDAVQWVGTNVVNEDKSLTVNNVSDWGGFPGNYVLIEPANFAKENGYFVMTIDFGTYSVRNTNPIIVKYIGAEGLEKEINVSGNFVVNEDGTYTFYSPFNSLTATERANANQMGIIIWGDAAGQSFTIKNAFVAVPNEN